MMSIWEFFQKHYFFFFTGPKPLSTNYQNNVQFVDINKFSTCAVMKWTHFQELCLLHFSCMRLNNQTNFPIGNLASMCSCQSQPTLWASMLISIYFIWQRQHTNAELLNMQRSLLSAVASGRAFSICPHP